MAELGHFSLLLALFLSGYAILADVLGLRGRSELAASGRNATIATLLALSGAIAALLVLLLKSDFSVTYVAEHTSISLPTPYKVSALWAGAAGSLLLWLWLQVGFIVWTFCRDRGKPASLLGGARILANLVSVYFLFVLIFDKNPFSMSTVTPADGAGLNPLLQHPAMALHPPTLFIGYAAFAVPFAWALVAIVAGPREAAEFFKERIQAWILWAWLFLTVGIALGAWWAYEELGWGGYWAWDPVENSSLMPWLTATALLHCSRIYSSKSGIIRWLVFLCLATFSMCIFGTFLTRYGLVTSVHAFPEPGLGILFMVLLVNLWLIAGGLLLFRIGGGKREPLVYGGMHRFVTWNNWLMLLMMVVIFVGTLFPFFSALVSDEKITLEPAYFTKITAPGGLLLILFIGACPFLVRYGLGRNLRMIGGIVAGAAAAGCLILSQVMKICAQRGMVEIATAERFGFGMMAMLACFIVCIYALANVAADILVRIRSTQGLELRWIGARIVHLGVILMFIGIAGSGGYDTEKHVGMRPGESVGVGDYSVTYDDLEADHGPNFTAVTANVTIRKQDKEVAKLKPALAFYSASGKRTSEIDVRRTLAGDLYLAVTEVDNTTQVINMTILIKPLINWIWLGSIISSVGALLVLASVYRKRIGHSLTEGGAAE